jgi:hypothetical protein
LYAVGWGGVILNYNGAEWLELEKLTSFGLLGVWGTAEDDVYVNGETFLHYNGIEWTPVTVRDEPHFQDVWAGDHESGREIIAVGTGGTVLRSSGGDLFSKMNVDGGDITTDLFGVGGHADSGAIFIVGASGTILQRDEADETLANWLDISPGAAADLYAVDVLADMTAIAVGAGGTVLEHDNGVWTEFNPTGEALHDVWLGVIDGDTVAHVVGNNGTVLYYNGGWQTPNSPTSTDLRAVFGKSDGDAYAVGDAGVMLEFDGATHNWSLINSGTIENLTGVYVSDGGGVFVSADHGRVFQLVNGTLTDMETKSGVDMNSLYGFDAGNIFVVGDFNHILHYGR